MRLIMASLLVLSPVLGLGTVTTERAEAGTITGSVTLTCNAWESNNFTVTYDRDNNGANGERWAIVVTDGAGKILYLDEATGQVGTTSGSGNGAFPYINSPDYNPLTFRWISLAGNGLDAQVAYETTGECLGLPTYGADDGGEEGSDEITLQPGCDMFPMPDTAVVGQFTRDTVLEWAPGQATDITVEAGKTAWVLSINATGTHYHIAIGCARAWVPVGSMGPNYDEVWHGASLPSNSNNP